MGLAHTSHKHITEQTKLGIVTLLKRKNIGRIERTLIAIFMDGWSSYAHVLVMSSFLADPCDTFPHFGQGRHTGTGITGYFGIYSQYNA